MIISVLKKVETPYIPGLLSFGEGPAILDALSRSPEVDLLFFDGHRIAHPRGISIASTLDFFVEIPTIGVAKSLLLWKGRKPPERKRTKQQNPSPGGRLLDMRYVQERGETGFHFTGK